jgi:hypothetical protein
MGFGQKRIRGSLSSDILNPVVDKRGHLAVFVHFPSHEKYFTLKDIVQILPSIFGAKTFSLGGLMISPSCSDDGAAELFVFFPLSTFFRFTARQVPNAKTKILNRKRNTPGNNSNPTTKNV